jgi:selenoprotein W-related protein
LAAELKNELGVEATLVPSKGGVFDVVVDGRLIFSKSQTDRFPNAGEVSGLIRATLKNI